MQFEHYTHGAQVSSVRGNYSRFWEWKFYIEEHDGDDDDDDDRMLELVREQMGMEEG